MTLQRRYNHKKVSQNVCMLENHSLPLIRPGSKKWGINDCDSQTCMYHGRWKLDICFWRLFPYPHGRDGDQRFGARIKSNSQNDAAWNNCSHWEQQTLQYLCRCKWKEAESGSIHMVDPLLLNLSTLHPTVTSEMVNHTILRLFRMFFHVLRHFSIRHPIPPFCCIQQTLCAHSCKASSVPCGTWGETDQCLSIFKKPYGRARLLPRATSHFACTRSRFLVFTVFITKKS